MEPARFETELRSALKLDLPYPERPPTRNGTEAAVLALFGWKEGRLHLFVTRRAETVGTHQGQMAFPGGVCEDFELGGKAVTALRETEEEVGIPRERIRVLGELPGLWTVTGFWVTPYVGILEGPVENLELKINPDEIAETVWISWEALIAPETYHREFRKIGAVNYPIHVFQIGEHRIWGATGSMVRNLVDRWSWVRERNQAP